jgi:hypothetical protein
MIAKHIPMKVPRRSSFRDLVAYITHAKGRQERIGLVQVTNCHQSEASDAVQEVLATQLRNRRACSDKTYHLLISFDAGDNPSLDARQSIEAALCEAIGFGGHQRISAVHTDTDNLHIHVAINKIHPQRLTIRNPYCDYKVLGAICQKLELAHGLAQTNHETLTRGARSHALDMEHAAGMESLLGWIRRECLTDLRQAQNWAALHEVLGRNGLALQERGNGLVISDQEGRVVKASSVARELSKAQLVKQFGPFEPASQRMAQAVRSYRMRPVSNDQGTDALYLRYQAEQAFRRDARARSVRELRQKKHELTIAAKNQARLKRGLIQQLDCDRLSKRVLYHQASAALRTDIQTFREQHRAGCKQIMQHAQPLAWFDWLANRAALNDEAALFALRRRKHRAERRANCLLGTIRQHGMAAMPGLTVDSVTKQGTIIYRDKDFVIRDSGNCLEVAEGLTQAGLEVALSMAMQRFGSRITLLGDAAFRERVLRTSKALKLSVSFVDRTQQHCAALIPKDTSICLKPQHGITRYHSDFGEGAARRYIAEREAKRALITDIPCHALRMPGKGGSGRFAGWRQIDEQPLVLLKNRNAEIIVLPVDRAALARVKRLKMGEEVFFNEDGMIRKRGLHL